MTGMSFDAKHLRDHLKLLAGLAEHFETHCAADVRKLSRQMHERALGTDILRCAFGDDVRAVGHVPLGFDLEAGEITWSRATLCFHLTGHVRPPFKRLGEAVSRKAAKEDAKAQRRF